MIHVPHALTLVLYTGRASPPRTLWPCCPASCGRRLQSSPQPCPSSWLKLTGVSQGCCTVAKAQAVPFLTLSHAQTSTANHNAAVSKAVQSQHCTGLSVSLPRTVIPPEAV